MLDATNKVVGFFIWRIITRPMPSKHWFACVMNLKITPPTAISSSWDLFASNNQQKAKDLLTVANREYPDDDRLLYASFQLLENELEPQDKRQAIVDCLRLMNTLAIAWQMPNFASVKTPMMMMHSIPPPEISNISFDDPEYWQPASVGCPACSW